MSFSQITTVINVSVGHQFILGLDSQFVLELGRYLRIPELCSILDTCVVSPDPIS